MTDMLASGVAFLDAQRKASMSQTIEYERDGDFVSISATLGATDYEVSDENGITMQAKSMDFIVSAGDLILSSVPIRPLIGDEIRLPQGDVTLLFEVVELNGREHFVEDGFGQTFRIHANQVGVTP